MKLASIAILVLLVGGGYYAASDTFKSKVDKLVEDHTEWTAENIQKDPEGYVRWAIKELESSKNNLKARQLDMRKKQSMADQDLALTTGLIKQLDEKMVKLKAAYKAAQASKSWPASVDGITINENNLKNMVVDADRRIKSAKRKAELATLIKLKSTTNLRLLENKLSELASQETELSLKLDEVKMNKALTGLTDINDNVRKIVTTAASIDTESSKEVTLDDIMAPASKADTRDKKFDSIMLK